MKSGAAVLMAELKIEWRNPSGIVSAALFSLLVLLTQALAFPTHLAARPDIAFAAFFISGFFASLLAENSRLARERKTGTQYMLALSTTNASHLFLAKSLATFSLMGMIQLCLFPCLILFFNLPLYSPEPGVALMCLCANFAIAGLTTLLGSATLSWKGIGSSLALPILILPNALPILAAVSIGTSLAWMHQPFIHYLKLLVASDIAVGMIGTLTYGKLSGRA